MKVEAYRSTYGEGDIIITISDSETAKSVANYLATIAALKIDTRDFKGASAILSGVAEILDAAAEKEAEEQEASKDGE